MSDLATDSFTQRRSDDMTANWDNAVTAAIGKTLKRLIKDNRVLRDSIPHQLIPLYRDWLIAQYEYNPEDIPICTRTGKPSSAEMVKPGTKLPVPGGRLWRRMVA